MIAAVCQRLVASLAGVSCALASLAGNALAATIKAGDTATMPLLTYICGHEDGDSVTQRAFITPHPVFGPAGNLNDAQKIFTPPIVTLSPEQSLQHSVLQIKTSRNSRAGLYQVTVRAKGTNPNCSYSDVTDMPLLVKPFVVASNKKIWWFNGEHPADYPTTLEVRAKPENSGPYTWKIALGEGWAAFSNDSDTITTQAPVVDIKTIGAPFENTGDVIVSVRANDTDGFSARVARVLTPFKIERVGQPRDMPFANGAFVTAIRYRIVDQFGDVLPRDIPVNEHFTKPRNLPPGVIRDDPNSNWIRGPDVGAVVAPNSLFDNINGCVMGYDPPGGGPNAPCRPMPQAPATPLSRDKIDHWCGNIYVGHNGQGGSGKGVLVAGLVWQRYIDHARHCDIYSPPDREDRLFPCKNARPICGPPL